MDSHENDCKDSFRALLFENDGNSSKRVSGQSFPLQSVLSKFQHRQLRFSQNANERVELLWSVMESRGVMWEEDDQRFRSSGSTFR